MENKGWYFKKYNQKVSMKRQDILFETVVNFFKVFQGKELYAIIFTEDFWSKFEKLIAFSRIPRKKSKLTKLLQ